METQELMEIITPNGIVIMSIEEFKNLENIFIHFINC